MKNKEKPQNEHVSVSNCPFIAEFAIIHHRVEKDRRPDTDAKGDEDDEGIRAMSEYSVSFVVYENV